MKLSKYNYVIKQDKVYVYNTLYKTFLTITEDVWEKCEENRFDVIDSRDLGKIVRSGVAFDEKIDEDYFLKDRIDCTLVSRDNMGIFLSMTQGCNFSCPYCFEGCDHKSSNSEYITEEGIDRVLDFVLSVMPRNLSIVYFGGEPTINQSRLIYSMKKVSSLADKINVTQSIITNGYVVTDALVDQMRKTDGITIQITIDGDEDNHNKYRHTISGKGSFKKVYDNVKRLAALFPQRLCIRQNIQFDIATNVAFIDRMRKDGLLELVDLSFSPVYNNDVVDRRLTENVLFLTDYAKKKNGNVVCFAEFGPCLAQFKYGFAIDERLNVYECPLRLYKKAVGHIDDEGRFIVTNASWYESLYNRKPCMKKCTYAPVCYGGCELCGGCRKEQIEQMLPSIMHEKIALYKERRYAAC